MIVDTLDNYKSYFATEIWEEIFSFLKTLDADSPEASHELRGRKLFVNVDEYSTKGVEDAVLESHKKYIDIQLLLDGEEYIDVYPVDTLDIKDPYDESRDVMFYHLPVKSEAVRVKLTPGTFTLLFPQDAHMPQLKVDQPQPVKKVVVKIDRSIFE